MSTAAGGGEREAKPTRYAEPKVEGREGPERVRLNDDDKSSETKISKDGLQVAIVKPLASVGVHASAVVAD